MLEGMLIEADDEGVKLTCSDLSISIETIIGATVPADGSVVLSGRLFADIVRKLPPTGVVDILVNSEMKTTIRCVGSRTVMTGMFSREYPELPKIDIASGVTVDQKKLRGMIQKTLFSVATDESRPILKGELMEISPDRLTLAALDGFRLAVSQETISAERSERVVIPSKAMGELLHILSDDGEVTIAMSDMYACFIVGGTRIVTRLLEGEFMRFRTILPSEWTTRAVVPTKAMADALARASLIANEGKNNMVKIIIGESELTLTSNSDNSQIHEVVDGVETEGKPLEIAFNAKYLTDMLRVIEDDVFQMKFLTAISPCVSTPVDGESYIYLLLPIRIFTA